VRHRFHRAKLPLACTRRLLKLLLGIMLLIHLSISFQPGRGILIPHEFSASACTLSTSQASNPGSCTGSLDSSKIPKMLMRCIIHEKNAEPGIDSDQPHPYEGATDGMMLPPGGRWHFVDTGDA
jgi:hypothetical protein